MSKIAYVRLGPALSHTIINSSAEPRTLYDDVQLLAFREPPPVCIDHQKDHRIGEVLNLYTFEDMALYPVVAPWLIARVRLHDNAPGWIRKGTGASISTTLGAESDFGGWQVRRKPFLAEVTLCSAKTQPCEPLARVLLIEDEPKPAPVAAARTATKLELQRAELNRRITAALDANPHADVGAIITGYKIEIGAMRVSGIDQAYAEFQRRRLAA